MNFNFEFTDAGSLAFNQTFFPASFPATPQHKPAPPVTAPVAAVVHHAPTPTPPKVKVFTPQVKESEVVKLPEENIITNPNNRLPVDYLEKLYFQNIGGTEILTVARHNTVGGEKIYFNPIKNIQDIVRDFDPLNLLMSETAQNIFNSYPINSAFYLPTSNTLSDDEIGDESVAGIGIQEEQEQLIVYVNVNYLEPDQYVEIQVATGPFDEDTFGVV
jgi:hypothetical protein